ncbi:hypothetical protein COLO4_04066 [Corchorus olitorius]|uniref:Uncharacterized protein n=1 Tax=Corchorus olitorius TaxID=93759 RepID=A0A1R3KVC0_9ROSI|nr:hypothetical protein COLO4_04066 [Corchorus olitorius]
MAAELHARRFGLLLALYSGFREALHLFVTCFVPFAATIKTNFLFNKQALFFD